MKLAELTTLQLGGETHVHAVASVEDAIDVLRQYPDAFILGGGSNVLACDAGIPHVLHVRSKGITKSEYGGRAYLTVAAGEDWDTLVATACDEGWSGIECLSGIPGSVGATPMQNVGAYGQEVATCITSIEALDLKTLRVRTFSPGDCAFGYRTSRFKREGGFLVLNVTFALVQSDYSAPLKYAELKHALAAEVAPLAKVREAVLALRRSKGMVIDPHDPDTKSAGSFFMNPVVDASTQSESPKFSAEPGKVKLSAAWLIEHSGFCKGYSENGAGISSKHALALINQGGTAAALFALSEKIRRAVQAQHGIMLQREPVLAGAFT